MQGRCECQARSENPRDRKTRTTEGSRLPSHHAFLTEAFPTEFIVCPSRQTMLREHLDPPRAEHPGRADEGTCLLPTAC